MSHTRSIPRLSPEERRRREYRALAYSCNLMESRINKTNEILIEDLKVFLSNTTNVVTEGRNYDIDHSAMEKLRNWHGSLRLKLDEAYKNLDTQRIFETRCELLESKIKEIVKDLSNSESFKTNKPNIRSIEDFEKWEDRLTQTLTDVEFQKTRDSVFLGRQAEKRLDLTGVDLDAKEKSRISDIQIARRMDKLNKLSKCIAQIEDEYTRESFVLEANPLLDMEHDDDFDDVIIEINTKVRNIKKKEQYHAEAIEEVQKILHIQSPDVPDISAAAESVSTKKELSDIKKRVKAVLHEEERKYEETFIRNAIQDTLQEMGYEYGEGFVETKFGPVMMAEKSSLPEYTLRIQYNFPDSQNQTPPSILSRVVAHGNTTPEQDFSAEKKICSDSDEMIEGLRKRGVEVEVKKRGAAGEYPLDRIGGDVHKEIDQSRQTTQVNRRRRARPAAAARRRNA